MNNTSYLCGECGKELELNKLHNCGPAVARRWTAEQLTAIATKLDRIIELLAQERQLKPLHVLSDDRHTCAFCRAYWIPAMGHEECNVRLRFKMSYRKS